MPPFLLGLDIEPMEAKSVETLPAGGMGSVLRRSARWRCCIVVEVQHFLGVLWCTRR
jgi:hypothetical protein